MWGVGGWGWELGAGGVGVATSAIDANQAHGAQREDLGPGGRGDVRMGPGAAERSMDARGGALDARSAALGRSRPAQGRSGGVARGQLSRGLPHPARAPTSTGEARVRIPLSPGAP